MNKIGLYFYCLGTFAAGVFDLIWRGFDAAHQPIQAWGDHIPGLAILGCITGVWMIAGVLALFWRRTAHAGAAALAGIYFVFAAFCLPRFYTAPHYLGIRPSVYIGVFAGIGIELIAFAAGLVLYASVAERESYPVAPTTGATRVGQPASLTPRSSARMLLAARWIFGLCSIDFGLAHLTSIQNMLIYVPKWLPPGGGFWVVGTGVCFVLAGVAILAGVLDALAAWMLGVMFLSFNLTILPTFVFADPHRHEAWGGNAYNLAAVGSAWILAAALRSQRDRFSLQPTQTP